MMDNVHLAIDDPSFVILPLLLISALSLLAGTMPKKLRLCENSIWGKMRWSSGSCRMDELAFLLSFFFFVPSLMIHSLRIE